MRPQSKSSAFVGMRTARALRSLRTPIGRRAARLRVFPSLVHEGMLGRIQPTFVVDVGANRGQFALDCRHVCPGIPIIAFEPLQSESRVLREVFRNDILVDVRGVALGRMATQATLHVSEAADNSSLMEITEAQVAAFPGTRAVSSVTVPVDSLDNQLAGETVPGDSLLKIDVQGYELEVLVGAKQCLSQFRWVYVELSFEQLYRDQPTADVVLAYLETQGFKLVDIVNTTHQQGRCLQFDALFESSTTRGEVPLAATTDDHAGGLGGSTRMASL